MKAARKASRKPKKTVKRAKKKKAKKPVKGSKNQVFRGTREKTVGGLKKSDLVRNKWGKVVSKKKNSYGKKIYKKHGLSKWIDAFMQARKNLGVKGFVPVKKGTKLYNEAMKLYKK